LEQVLGEFPPCPQTAELCERWAEMEMCELLQRLESVGARLQGKVAPATHKRFIPYECPGEEFPGVLIEALVDACRRCQADQLRRGEHYHVTPLPCNSLRIRFTEDVRRWATEKGLVVRMRLLDPAPSVLLLNPDRQVAGVRHESGCYDLGPLPQFLDLGDMPHSPVALFLVSTNSEVTNGRNS
jgi:hypothetical protein